MKKLFFILIFTFFLQPKTVFGYSDNYTPTIEFYSSYGNLYYNFNQTTEQITDISLKNNSTEKGIFASGLSTIDINVDIELNNITDVNEQSQLIVYPHTVKVKIYYTKPIIYISNQLQPNSCEYDLVLRHEQTHQQINQKTMEYFLPLFRKGIIKIARSIPPLVAPNLADIKATSDQLSAIYYQKINKMVNIYKEFLFKEQFKLDNHINYEYENSLCR